jgi:hypothetical protein
MMWLLQFFPAPIFGVSSSERTYLERFSPHERLNVARLSNIYLE